MYLIKQLITYTHTICNHNISCKHINIFLGSFNYLMLFIVFVFIRVCVCFFFLFAYTLFVYAYVYTCYNAVLFNFFFVCVTLLYLERRVYSENKHCHIHCH